MLLMLLPDYLPSRLKQNHEVTNLHGEWRSNAMSHLFAEDLPDSLWSFASHTQPVVLILQTLGLCSCSDHCYG